MTPMKLLKAMEFLEDDLVMEAESIPAKRPRRLNRRLLIAAALLAAALLVTACAAIGGADWFLGYFSEKTPEELSEEQVDYIVANTIHVNKSRTVNGHTLTLQSAFSDGKDILLQFELAAPEGTVLDADQYSDLQSADITNEEGKTLGITMSWTLRDEDRTDNRAELLYTITDCENFVGHRCRLTIDGLTGTTWLEPLSLGTRSETLTEGTWTFDIYFPEDCGRYISLVEEPVTIPCTIVTGYEQVAEDEYRPIKEEIQVEVTALNLWSLSMELRFHVGEEPDNLNLRDLYVVMKDGSRVPLKGHWVSPDYNTYKVETPLILDDVDHILFPGGEKIPAP